MIPAESHKSRSFSHHHHHHLWIQGFYENSKITQKTESHHSEKLIHLFLRVWTLNLKIATAAVIPRRLAVWKHSIIAHSHKDTVNHLHPPTKPSMFPFAASVWTTTHRPLCAHKHPHTRWEIWQRPNGILNCQYAWNWSVYWWTMHDHI